jgi:hypothetical protein
MTTAQLLTLDQILAQPDASAITAEVEVGPWGGKVRIRALSLEERDQIRREARDGDELNSAHFNALVLETAVVEPALTAGQAAQLTRKAFGPVQALLDEIYELSGITPAGQISKRAVDDAERRFRKR